MSCAHCGRPFGYTIDGKFYPVASHGHMVDGVVRIFTPESPQSLGQSYGSGKRKEGEGGK